jgi:hypothetical protein
MVVFVTIRPQIAKTERQGRDNIERDICRNEKQFSTNVALNKVKNDNLCDKNI